MALIRIVVVMVVVLMLLFFLLPVIGIMLANHSLPQLITSRTLLPAPWLMPKRAGGSALRLAMIHDVLHERFLIHGQAWFEHRHAQTAQALAKYDDGTVAKDARYFSLLDDFAVDFDRLGRPAEGISVLRRKLDLQQPLGADGQRPAPRADFYTTYANLGTLLAHVHLKGALAKDAEAIAGLREGLTFIEQSIAVNPDAHFGREVWQAVTLKFLLHAIEQPDLLTDLDLVGLDWSNLNRHILESNVFTPRALLKSLVANGNFDRLTQGPRSHDDEQTVEQIRRSIAVLGVHRWEFSEHFIPSGRYRIPFDEPALALVGIWTLGSGANPHFALAFAHLMEGLDQPGIAWNAYERAGELATRFWPDSDIQQKMTVHCREQQGYLEARLSWDPSVLRQHHRTELEFGHAQQQAFQAYEAEHIAKGEDPAAPDFYAAFFHGRPAIASDPGNADTIVYDRPFDWFDGALILQAIICSVAAVAIGSTILTRRKELAA